jgi:NADPH2:quinone reductase
MQAVRFSEFGIEKISVEEMPEPSPNADEVLIAVKAATINPIDWAVVSGAAAPGFPSSFRPPFTPGWDLAGRVIGLGEGVSTDYLGARVVGFSPWFDSAKGTHQSVIALPVANVAVASEALDFAGLTTIGLNGLTAWRAVDEARVQPGEVVAITGAAGAVGGFALQLLVHRGVRVIAAVSERDAEHVRELGASDVVVREHGDLAQSVVALSPGGVDVLIDTASIAAPALGAIRDRGRYVTTTTLPAAERGIAISKVYAAADAAALNALVHMASSGTLHMPVAKIFDVAHVQDAYTEFIIQRHYGRIVLTFQHPETR